MDYEAKLTAAGLSDIEIREALDGNLCRCAVHQRVVAAVKRAAEAGYAARLPAP